MKKRVLFIVPYAPNLIRVRPYNLIRHVAGLGHQVTVLTLWSDEQERQSLEHLEPLVERVIALRLSRERSLWNALKVLPSRQPLQSVYCWQPALAREISALLRPGASRPAFDVVHVEHLRGAAYGLFVKSLGTNGAGTRLPVVWDSVDSISMLFRQAVHQSRTLFGKAITRLELGRTEQYEAWLLSQFDKVTVTSPADREALLSLLPANGAKAGASAAVPDIAVLPNGVDLEYFTPGDSLARQPATVVVSGKMSYHANVTMVLHLVEAIMPLVWARRPDAKVVVVGKDPSREILALGDSPQVTVTGTVQDLPPYLQQATVAVAPIAYGAGIQNKVLEAMACATPVVVSPQAVGALQAKPGMDLLVGENPQAFAGRILELLDSPERSREVGDAGRCYVETYHHWGNVAARLADLYDEAIG